MIFLELVGHNVTLGDDLVQISKIYYSIPLVLFGLADALSQLYILEFIISQAPANMSGMIVGTIWFIATLTLS